MPWAVETLTASAILLAPLGRPAFHLHHWLIGWLVALVARHPPWWSDATQAVAIGVYLNGIVVYGRDPLLGCDAVFFAVGGSGCDPAWLCTRLGVPPALAGLNLTHAQKAGPSALDWRNCTRTSKY